MSPPLRIGFAGTPEFAAVHLRALLRSTHQVTAVYTQPDRPRGRGRRPQPSPVKRLATEAGLPLLQPATLQGADAGAATPTKDPSASQEPSALRETAPLKETDVLVVVAYGLILPPEILALPRYGCINVHASLLPRWRGAAPIERAILAGDRQSGVTVMLMDTGLDTGPILHAVPLQVAATETRRGLEARLAEAGQEALLEVLADLSGFLQRARPQNESEATYAKRLSKSEALIRWEEAAMQTDRRIRAGVGRLPAYSWFKGERLRILEAEVVDGAAAPGTVTAVARDSFSVACGDGALRVKSVQMPGKNPVPVRDFFNARADYIVTGDVFSPPPEPTP